MSDAQVTGRVAELLAGYLTASGRLAWPGTDGLVTGEVVLAEYLPAAAAGLVPGVAELRVRHPDLAEAITVLLGRGPSPPAFPQELTR